MLTPLHYKTLAPFAFSCLLIFAGCGSDSGPLSSNPGTLSQTADGTTYLTFSPEALARVGKIAAIPAEGRTVSRTFSPGQTASMQIVDRERRGVRDDLEIRFTVHAGDLSESTTITMTAYGNTLSDLVLAFEPHGLVFNSPARIDLKIGAERVDRSLLDLQALLLPFGDVEAYHDHDGDVETAHIVSVRTFIRVLFKDVETFNLLLFDYAQIAVDVPGFSRYGLRRSY